MMTFVYIAAVVLFATLLLLAFVVRSQRKSIINLIKEHRELLEEDIKIGKKDLEAYTKLSNDYDELLNEYKGVLNKHEALINDYNGLVGKYNTLRENALRICDYNDRLKKEFIKLGDDYQELAKYSNAGAKELSKMIQFIKLRFHFTDAMIENAFPTLRTAILDRNHYIMKKNAEIKAQADEVKKHSTNIS